jgi:hypothetical protein
MRSALAAIFLGAVLVLPAMADETPKRGGTFTFMIPPDAPPSHYINQDLATIWLDE